MLNKFLQNRRKNARLRAFNSKSNRRSIVNRRGSCAIESLETRRVLATMVDINDNYFDSSPESYVDLNGTMIFSAFSSVDTTIIREADREVWKSDGTAAGTTRLKDIFPGIESSNPRGFVRAGNYVYFAADTAAGTSLYRTDGTTTGTVQIVSSSLSVVGPAGVIGDKVLFVAADSFGSELWLIGGTTAEAIRISNINPNGHAGFRGMTVLNSIAYFGADESNNSTYILWKSDGTAAGTTRVLDANGQPIIVGNNLGLFSTIEVLGNSLYFTASDTQGRELWKSDGTSAGTSILKNIGTGAASSSPRNLAAVGTSLVFTADDGNGIRLWSTDGTAAGTIVLSPSPTIASLASGLLGTHLSTGLAFYSLNGNLWRTDGTATGTFQLTTGLNGNFRGSGIQSPDSNFYFSYADELWVSDGTIVGTHIVRSLLKIGFPVL